MSIIKSIIYFGADPDFVKELDSFINRNGIGTYDFLKQKYTKGKILESLSLFPLHMIYPLILHNNRVPKKELEAEPSMTGFQRTTKCYGKSKL